MTTNTVTLRVLPGLGSGVAHRHHPPTYLRECACACERAGDGGSAATAAARQRRRRGDGDSRRRRRGDGLGSDRAEIRRSPASPLSAGGPARGSQVGPYPHFESANRHAASARDVSYPMSSPPSTSARASRKRARPRPAPPPLRGWAVVLAVTARDSLASARIWARSLACAEIGATVVATADDAPADARRVVVVADDDDGRSPPQQRRGRWPDKNGAGQEIEVVNTDWVAHSLLRGEACRPSLYALKESGGGAVEGAVVEAPVAVEQQQKQQQPRCAGVGGIVSAWRSGVVLPRVWASGDEGEALSSARRREMCGAVPAWLVEYPRCNPGMAGFCVRNRRLVRQLRRVSEKREILNRNPVDMRFLTYARAAAFIAALPFEVECAEELREVPGVAGRIVEAVQVFLAHGRILELDEFEDRDSELAAVDRLSQVHGISIAVARKLFLAGVRTVEGAAEYYRESGSPKAPVGTLASLEFAPGRITRVEAGRILEEVAGVASKALPQHALIFRLGGGFRRGNESGHDADILFCHEDRRAVKSVMSELVSALESAGLIASVLRGQVDKAGSSEIRYAQHKDPASSGHMDYPHAHDVQLTIYKLASPAGVKHVRVDFVGVRRREEWPFALLAWSGSTLFQRELHRWCDAKFDWNLNSHGLFCRSSNRPVVLKTEIRTEHDIFSALGLSYLPPFERCC